MVNTTLRVSDLTVQRGQNFILQNISWCVQRGEHWVILGANGSGKTSLLSALTGYLTPTAGEIEVLSERFGESDWRELRKRIGMVSTAIRQRIPNEEPALETIMSGRYAMIDFWGEPTRTDVKRARQILREIGCAALAPRPWLYLSQGERQRILIGRALMARPVVLILDEPCAGLDPAAREHFLQFVQRLGQSGRCPTLILVTHHVEEIMPVFSHGLILEQGRVLAAGRLKSIMNSSILGKAFHAEVGLTRRNHRYALRILSPSKSWM